MPLHEAYGLTRNPFISSIKNLSSKKSKNEFCKAPLSFMTQHDNVTTWKFYCVITDPLDTAVSYFTQIQTYTAVSYFTQKFHSSVSLFPNSAIKEKCSLVIKAQCWHFRQVTGVQQNRQEKHLCPIFFKKYLFHLPTVILKKMKVWVRRNHRTEIWSGSQKSILSSSRTCWSCQSETHISFFFKMSPGRQHSCCHFTCLQLPGKFQ